jgi:hypothetical protein
MPRLTNTFEGRVYELMQAGFPRQEAIAIAQRERSDAVGSSPADLDPVEAAAAPIPVESDLGAQRRARLENAGMDPEQAGRVVAAQQDLEGRLDPRHGVNPDRLFNHPTHGENTPAKNAALAQRVQRSKDADAAMSGMAASMYPHQQFENDAATGAELEEKVRQARIFELQTGPSRYDPVVRPGRRSPAPQRQDYGRTVPGPRTMDGSDPAPGRAFASQEEADAYYQRPEDPNNPGLFLPSQADADMRKRGFVPVMTPDGVRYQLEAQDSRYDVGYGMQGRKPWLTEGTRSYKPLSAGEGAGLDVSKEEGGQPLEYVRTPAPSPLTGEGSARGQVYTLGPGAAVREYNQDMQLERQAIRMAADAGVPVEEFVANDPQFKVLLNSPAAVRRLKVAENRRKEQQERRDAWKAQAMLAGGNRAKNAVNAVGMLPADERNQVLQYWASGGTGSTPLDVARAAAGSDADPAKAIMAMIAQERFQQGLPPHERARRARAAGAKIGEGDSYDFVQSKFSEAKTYWGSGRQRRFFINAMRDIGWSEAEAGEYWDQRQETSNDSDAAPPSGFTPGSPLPPVDPTGTPMWTTPQT